MAIKRKHVYRTIRREGGSTVMSLAPGMIPEDWEVVSLSLVSKDLNPEGQPFARPSVCIKIEKVGCDS